ncbi:MAG TPA: aminomethyl-transferring glycine dehydrogenase [Verrucomicrobiae bacterium]|jgi:glycine dehydrogenase|nr:aminomethyl-transferring glycine dehydrogenase [Verrucomicrobiae bacterium]
MMETVTQSTPSRAPHDSFVPRHIGPSLAEQGQMLQTLGASDLDEFIARVVPPALRVKQPLALPAGITEQAVLAELRALAGRNQVFRTYIGMGYSDCFVPPVIQRNILENPGWYTQYTPYQAEISQGRLEALLIFQTMISDLTALPVANASLLDEATAAAEAMHLCQNARPDRTVFFVSKYCHPQTIDVVRTRARPLGIKVEVGSHETFAFHDQVFGALVQYPSTHGAVENYEEFAQRAHAAGALVAVAADLLALTLLRPPGEFGADVAIGSAQRFGVPLGYGGPHAAFFATSDAYKRLMPGRLVGVSKDAQGRRALRLALQTREQHIRREKATSNICTAQALLANMAAMFAVYHGPERLKQIARRIRQLTLMLAAGLRKLGLELAAPDRPYFDTITVRLGSGRSAEIVKLAEERRMNFRVVDGHTLGISLDETTGAKDVQEILAVFNGGTAPPDLGEAPEAGDFPAPWARTTPFLQEAVFHSHLSETQMLRYLRRLENKDLSLTTSMIPLGSCTMKLNGTAEMLPISWPEFSRLHPFAPLSQTRGYQALFRQLEEWLCEITGFDGCSLQPNAGAQGEYAGLLMIERYHESRGDARRRVCLIPTSAHGTNPASAAMAGFRIVPVLCDAQGNVDVADLRAKAAQHRDELAALMVTYPSTHGVFEEGIAEICQIIHEHGGQVYMDGANLNAQAGLCRPGDLGADVCHINLHKTFCIPHGGGGPGMGPICVAEHLVEFLPGHPVVNLGGENPIGAVSAAPWGSANILLISWAYIALMGGAGLTQATKVAILNANYIAARLHPFFPVLYRGEHGFVAHECIVDLRDFKSVTVEDVAKRLMDYGFHAPTISFPVPGTMMIEPTESEAKAELDRFCDALILIHAEIKAIESGQADAKNNVIKQAPHTADVVLADAWDRPYTRAQAAYPAPWTRENKFWPPVSRIDNVYGDRNLVCSCAAAY